MTDYEEKRTLKEIQELSKKFLLNTYARHDVSFKYGSGEFLFDIDGKKYIDFMCGISVTNLGHSDPDIIETVRSQADKLFHSSNLFYSEEAALLSEALVQYSFPGKVFLSNSGTEANEAAFKFARKYATTKNKDKPVIIALKNSFHGRSVAGMSMTGQSKIRNGFGELLSGIDFVEPNNEEDLVHAFDKHENNVAALIMEPVQGEIGIVPIKSGFASLARKLTLENEALLIFDEIQTGMGRTGKLFAFQHYDFTPDVMTLAKALGSGFPIGAMIVSDQYTDVFTRGTHGSTFGGNHLAAAIAYETLRIMISRDVLKNVNHMSGMIFDKLKEMKAKYPIISEIRGVGLHIGLEFNIPARPISEKCLENGLVVNATNENVIRIMPPLTITASSVEEGMDIFEKTVKSFNE